MTFRLYRGKLFSLKIITLWVLFCFSIQVVSWAGLDTFEASVSQSSNRFRANSLAKLLKLQIPPDFGIIKQTFLPANFGSDSSPRLVVHIQDAHGVAEAQRHIERILNRLTSRYGFKQLLVEGAVGHLEPERFDFFKPRGLNKKVWSRLFEEGVLNGTDFYLLKSNRKIHASGTENEAVYIKNLELFQKVIRARKTSGRWIQLIQEKTDRLATRTLRKEKREFLRDWYRFEKGDKSLLDYFGNLRKQSRSLAGIALEDRKLQITWPFLTRMAALQDEEKNIDFEKVTQEKETFLARLKEKKVDPTLLSRFERFEREGNLRSLFEKLFEALGNHPFSFVPYSHFITWARCLILRQEIQPERLSEEIEAFSEEILHRIAKTKGEKLVISIFQRLSLLRKMFALELSPSEWGRARVDNRLSPKALVKDLEGFSDRRNIRSLQTLFRRAKEFYETAQRRDQILFENTLSTMKNERVDKAILITGGFHGEGLKAQWKRAGVAFVEIQPAVTEETSHQTYLDRMRELDLPNTIRSHLAPPDALQGEETLARQGALAFINGRVQEALNQTTGKTLPSGPFWGASLGKKVGERMMRIAKITIRPFGKVAIPEEYQDLIVNPSSVIVAPAKTEFRQIWQWLLESRTVVLRGDFHDAHRLYSFLSLRTKNFDWLNKHDFRSRLMVVAHGDKFIGIHNGPKLAHLIDKLEGDTSHLIRHHFLIPVGKVLSIAKTEGRELHVRALKAKIDLLYNVFAPTAQEAVDLMAEHLDIQEGHAILDMGTGTGVLALLAGKTVRERGLKDVKVIATDVNPWAVQNAERNVGKFGFRDLIEVRGPGNLFDTVRDLQFDLILFNAPWIFRKPRRMLDRARYDEDFATLRQFIAEGRSHLKQGGRILLEYSNLSESALYPATQNLQSWLEQHGLVIRSTWEKKRNPPRSIRNGKNKKRQWRPVNEKVYLYEIRAASLGSKTDGEGFLDWIGSEFFEEGAFERKKAEIKRRLEQHSEWFPDGKEPDFYPIFSLLEENPRDEIQEPLLSSQVLRILQARTLVGAPVDRLWFDLQQRFLHSYFKLHESWMTKGQSKRTLDRISQILTELVYYIHVSALVIALQADLVDAANRQDMDKMMVVSGLLGKLDQMIRKDSQYGTNAFTKVTGSLPELALLVMSDFVGAETPGDYFRKKKQVRGAKDTDMSLLEIGQKIMDRVQSAGGKKKEPASILVSQLSEAAGATIFWPPHLYKEMLPLDFLSLFHHLDNQLGQHGMMSHEVAWPHVEWVNDLDLRLIATKLDLLLDLAQSGNRLARAAVGMFLLLMPHVFLEGKKNRRSPMREYMENVKLPDKPLVDTEKYREGILSGLNFLRGFKGIENMVLWMEFNFQLVYFQAMGYHDEEGKKGTWVRLRDVLLRNQRFKKWWNREPLRKSINRQRDHRRQQIEILNHLLKRRHLPLLEAKKRGPAEEFLLSSSPSAQSLGKTKAEPKPQYGTGRSARAIRRAIREEEEQDYNESLAEASLKEMREFNEKSLKAGMKITGELIPIYQAQDGTLVFTYANLMKLISHPVVQRNGGRISLIDLFLKLVRKNRVNFFGLSEEQGLKLVSEMQALKKETKTEAFLVLGRFFVENVPRSHLAELDDTYQRLLYRRLSTRKLSEKELFEQKIRDAVQVLGAPAALASVAVIVGYRSRRSFRKRARSLRVDLYELGVRWRTQWTRRVFQGRVTQAVKKLRDQASPEGVAREMGYGSPTNFLRRARVLKVNLEKLGVVVPKPLTPEQSLEILRLDFEGKVKEAIQELRKSKVLPTRDKVAKEMGYESKDGLLGRAKFLGVDLESLGVKMRYSAEELMKLKQEDFKNKVREAVKKLKRQATVTAVAHKLGYNGKRGLLYRAKTLGIDLSTLRVKPDPVVDREKQKRRVTKDLTRRIKKAIKSLGRDASLTNVAKKTGYKTPSGLLGRADNLGIDLYSLGVKRGTALTEEEFKKAIQEAVQELANTKQEASQSAVARKLKYQQSAALLKRAGVLGVDIAKLGVVKGVGGVRKRVQEVLTETGGRAQSLGDSDEALRIRYSNELRELVRMMAGEVPGELTEADVLERIEKEGLLEFILRLYTYAQYGNGPSEVNQYLMYTFKGHLTDGFVRSWMEGLWFKDIKAHLQSFEKFRLLYGGYFDEQKLPFFEQNKLFEWEGFLGKLARNKDFESEFGPDHYLDGFRLAAKLRDHSSGFKFNPNDRAHRIAFFTFVLEQLREKTAQTTSGAYYAKQDEILTLLVNGKTDVGVLFTELLPDYLQWFPTDFLFAIIKQYLDNKGIDPDDKAFNTDDLLRQITRQTVSWQKTSEVEMLAQQIYLFFVLASKPQVKNIVWDSEFVEQARRFLMLPEMRSFIQNGDPDHDWRKEFPTEGDDFFAVTGTRRTAFLRASGGLFTLFRLFPEATTEWIKLNLKKSTIAGTLKGMNDAFVLDVLSFIQDDEEILAEFKTYSSPDLIDFFATLPDLDYRGDDIFVISMEPEYILSLYERTRQLINGEWLDFRDEETRWALFMLAYQVDRDWKLGDLEKGLKHMFASQNPKMKEAMNQFLNHANLTNRLGVIEEFEKGPLKIPDSVEEEFIRLFEAAGGNAETESRLIHTLLTYRWIRARSKAVQREVRTVGNEPLANAFLLEAIEENNADAWREFFAEPLGLHQALSFADMLHHEGPYFHTLFDIPLSDDRRLMITRSMDSQWILSVVEIDANGEKKVLKSTFLTLLDFQRMYQQGIPVVVDYLREYVDPRDLEKLEGYFGSVLNHVAGKLAIIFYGNQPHHFRSKSLAVNISEIEILEGVRQRLDAGKDVKSFLLEILKPVMDKLLALGLRGLDWMIEPEQKEFLLKAILTAMFSPIPFASLSDEAVLDFTKEFSLTEEERSPSFSKLLEVRDRVLNGKIRMDSLLDRAVHYSVIHRAVSEAGAERPIDFPSYEWRVRQMDYYLKERPRYIAQYWVDLEREGYLEQIYKEMIEKDGVFKDKGEFLEVVREIIRPETDSNYLTPRAEERNPPRGHPERSEGSLRSFGTIVPQDEESETPRLLNYLTGIFSKYPVLVRAMDWARGFRDIELEAQGRMVHARGYVGIKDLWEIQSQTYVDYLAVSHLRFGPDDTIRDADLTSDERFLKEQHHELVENALLDPEGLLTPSEREELLLSVEAYVRRKLFLAQNPDAKKSPKPVTLDQMTRVKKHMRKESDAGRMSLSYEAIRERLLAHYDRVLVMEAMYAVLNGVFFKANREKGDADRIKPYRNILRSILEKVAVAFPLVEDQNLRVRFALTERELESQSDDDLLSLLEDQTTLFEDRLRHLVNRSAIGYPKEIRAKIQSRGKSFRELLKSIQVEFKDGLEKRHFVVTRGPLALFRGDIACDCSKNMDIQGAPVFHTLDWNNLYWIGEGGYAGAYDLSFSLASDQENPEEKIKILGLDTVNRFPSYLIPQLIQEVEKQALQLGYLGIALPRLLGSSFNYQGAKTVLGRMDRFKSGPVFRGEPRFKEAKEAIDRDKGQDEHHAINLEGGDFIFLIPDADLLSDTQRITLERFLRQVGSMRREDKESGEPIDSAASLGNERLVTTAAEQSAADTEGARHLDLERGQVSGSTQSWWKKTVNHDSPLGDRIETASSLGGETDQSKRDRALHELWALLAREKNILDIDPNHPDSRKLDLLTNALRPLFQDHGLIAFRPVLVPAIPTLANLMKDRNSRLSYVDENIARFIEDAATKDPTIESIYSTLHMALEAPMENVIQHGNGGAVLIFQDERTKKYILAVLDQGPGMDLSSWLAGKWSPAGELHHGLISLTDRVPRSIDRLLIRSQGYEYDIPDWKGLVPRNDIPEQGTLVIMEVSSPASSLGKKEDDDLEEDEEMREARKLFQEAMREEEEAGTKASKALRKEEIEAFFKQRLQEGQAMVNARIPVYHANDGSLVMTYENLVKLIAGSNAAHFEYFVNWAKNHYVDFFGFPPSRYDELITVLERCVEHEYGSGQRLDNQVAVSHLYAGYGERDKFSSEDPSARRLLYDRLILEPSRVLSKLVTKPEPIHWQTYTKTLHDLTGIRLGKTNSQGDIFFSPFKEYLYVFPVEGFGEKGWEAAVISTRSEAHFYEFTVRLFREGQKSIYRTFQIGSRKKSLRGYGKETRKRKEALAIDDRLGLRALSSLMMEPKTTDWEAEAYRLPPLAGLRLGITHRRGGFRFSPSEGFPWDWFALGKEEEGWNGVIRKSRVENGVFEFEVEFTKEEQSIRRTFQISSFTKILGGRGRQSGKTLEVLDIADHLGLQGVSQLVRKPVDFDWQSHTGTLPNLDGLLLGVTDQTGAIQFRPMEKYPFYWRVLGLEDKAWGARVVSGVVRGNYYELTVEFTKGARAPIVRTFQLGRFTRLLHGVGKEKGKSIEVLDIDDRLGMQAISELVTKPLDFDWQVHAKELPDVRGLYLGETDALGSVLFTPILGYPYDWNILGVKGKSWKAEIIDGSVFENGFEFRVRLTRGGKPIIRTFQIGRYTKSLKERGADRKSMGVLEINNRLGLRALAELMTGKHDFDKEPNQIPDLRGLRLGTTDIKGAYSINFAKWFRVQWPALGFKESGWEGKIVHSDVRNGIFEFTVEFTKVGQKPIQRSFQLGRFKRTLRGQGPKSKRKIQVWEIGSHLGIRGLSELLRKPMDFDWKANARKLPRLAGLWLGVTNRRGWISFDPVDNYEFWWQVLGFEEAGWHARILDGRVRDTFYELTVELTKGKRRPMTRTFQIGHFMRKVHGVNVKKGEIKEVLDIDDRLGLRAISDLITRPLDFDWQKRQLEILDMRGLQVGSTTSQGIIHFSPVEGYSSAWAALGLAEKDWEGTIVESGVQNGVFQFAVEFTKLVNHIIRRTFQIGPFTRYLRSVGGKKEKKLEVWDIDDQMGLRAIRELVNKPSDFDWESNASHLPKLDGLRLGKIDQKGILAFSPVDGYSFRWSILGSNAEGWEASAVRSEVKNGRFEFTVRFTKEGENPFARTFQIGPYRRKLKAVKERKDQHDIESVEVLDIDDRMGIRGIREVMTKPKDFDWEAHANDLPNLRGLRLGVVNKYRALFFSPVKDNPFHWFPEDVKEGQKAVIIDSGVLNGRFQFKIEFSKEGETPILRTFQIGPYTKLLKGGAEVLDIDDRMGIRALKELLTKPADFDWEAQSGQLPDVRGLRLGETDKDGAMKFSPVKGYRYEWSLLEGMGKGWEAVIVNGEIRNGIFHLTVKFNKKGSASLERTYRIGPDLRAIVGRNREKGKTIQMWSIHTVVEVQAHQPVPQRAASLGDEMGLVFRQDKINGDEISDLSSIVPRKKRSQWREPNLGELAKSTSWYVHSLISILCEGYNKILNTANTIMTAAIMDFIHAWNSAKNLLAKAAATVRYITLASMPAIKILRDFRKNWSLGFLSIAHLFSARSHPLVSSSSAQGRKSQVVQSKLLSTTTTKPWRRGSAYHKTSRVSENEKRMKVTPTNKLNRRPPYRSLLKKGLSLSISDTSLGRYRQRNIVFKINQDKSVKKSNKPSWVEVLTVIHVTRGFIRPGYPEPVARMLVKKIEPLLELLEGRKKSILAKDPAIRAFEEDIQWILESPVFERKGVKFVSGHETQKGLALLMDLQVLEDSTADQLKRLAANLDDGDRLVTFRTEEGMKAWNRRKPKPLQQLIQLLSPRGIRVVDIVSEHPSARQVGARLGRQFDQGLFITGMESAYSDLEISIELDRFRFDGEKLGLAGLNPNQAIALLRQIANVTDSARRRELYRYVLGEDSFDTSSHSWYVGENLIHFIREEYAAREVLAQAA